jgi:type II secretory ATPase GspE/PulE/Tfp pilus assembly ATPase PilB-like protein
MLTATPEIKSMIAAGTNDDQVKAQAIKKGMKTLRNAATEQVLTGVTTLAEILRVVDMRQE